MSGRQDSNLRPPGPKPGALPACATSRFSIAVQYRLLLTAVRAGFEPASISTNNTLIIKYIQDAKHCRSILVSEITFDPFIRTKVIIPDYMSCILLKVILIF